MDIDRKQMRLSSCVETIIKVHTRLEVDRLDPLLLQKFRLLEKSLKNIELCGVSELDVQRVEEATNRLLWELKYLFSQGTKPSIFTDVTH